MSHDKIQSGSGQEHVECSKHVVYKWMDTKGAFFHRFGKSVVKKKKKKTVLLFLRFLLPINV